MTESRSAKSHFALRGKKQIFCQRYSGVKTLTGVKSRQTRGIN